MWRNQLECARRRSRRPAPSDSDIVALGVTNQRETAIVWDRATGEPLINAIVWQDRRTAEACDALETPASARWCARRPACRSTRTSRRARSRGSSTTSRARGRVPRPASSRSARSTRGSSGSSPAGPCTSPTATNASRTLLFDIERGEWDDELLALFGVPRALLPEVVRSSGVVGATAPGVFDAAIPIASIVGDQQAALVGNGCFSAGDAKVTFGTGIFALMHTGTTRAHSETLAATVAAQIGDELEYALEGSIFMGGAVVQWIVEGLKLADSPAAAQALAETVPDSNGVVFVPALTGLGAPEWDPLARGAIFGLTRGATDAHVARAAMEAIPLQVGDLMVAMERDAGHQLAPVRADGGVTVNALVMQTLADVLDRPVEVAQMAESTALGAAYLAGLAVGVWSGPDDLPLLTAVARTYPAAARGSRADGEPARAVGRGGQALDEVGARVETTREAAFVAASLVMRVR